MIWEVQTEKQYCLIHNPKNCATQAKCCSFCKKKSCEWRCNDNCETCKYLTNEICYFSNVILPVVKKEKTKQNVEVKFEKVKEKKIKQNNVDKPEKPKLKPKIIKDENTRKRSKHKLI